MSRPILILSQLDNLIQVVDTNSHTSWQTVQIQIGWLLKKQTGLDLYCLQRLGISGFSRTTVNRKLDTLVVCMTRLSQCCNGVSGETVIHIQLNYYLTNLQAVKADWYPAQCREFLALSRLLRHCQRLLEVTITTIFDYIFPTFSILCVELHFTASKSVLFGTKYSLTLVLQNTLRCHAHL